jgi:hypothetical protein
MLLDASNGSASDSPSAVCALPSIVKTQRYNAAAADSNCELLCELFTGATGVVCLGKILSGKDAGRLVMLRPVSARAAASIKVLVDRVRQINHPRLLKVVGCFRSGQQHYVASDYISGVSFVELGPALLPSDQRAVGVAVRVVHDTLLAAQSGKRLLEGLYGYRVERCMYADTIWVADFGKAFLSELAVFEAVLCETKSGVSGVRGSSYRESEDTGSEDVVAAGNLLFEILSRNSGQRGNTFASRSSETKALASVVTTALSADRGQRYANAAEMAEALAQLPAALDVSIQTVRQCVAEALGAVLEQRRERLTVIDTGPASRISGLVRAQSTESERVEMSFSKPDCHARPAEPDAAAREELTSIWVPHEQQVEAGNLPEMQQRRPNPMRLMLVSVLLLTAALLVLALVGY